MSIRRGFVWAAVAAAMAMPGTVLAAEQAEAAGAKYTSKIEGRRHRMMRRLDKDGDGQISVAERQAARESRRKLLEQYYTDGDGVLSEAEREVMRQDRIKALIGEFDKDGDGQLSPEEKQNMRNTLRARREAR